MLYRELELSVFSVSQVLMASSSTNSKESNQVTFEEQLSGLRVTLNRPTKLNSLTYGMISQIFRVLKERENDPNVKVVIIKGNGRAFCAGGDLMAFFQISTVGHWTFGATYYNKQISLDYLLATYKKPLVSLIDGMVMGGGAGLSMHGAFRIATENAIFAMPENSIGLVPDVGASHFLTRLPGFFGEFLSLTGARIDGTDMVACGLATHFVLSKDLVPLESALCVTDDSELATISGIIGKYAHRPHIKQDSAYDKLDIINKCFSKNTMEEILSSVEDEAVKDGSKLLAKALTSMKKAAPTSLKATLKSIREGREQTVDKCFLRDSVIVCNMLRGTVNRDFYEGTRAMVIDKDKNPKWEPSKLELVTEEMVDRLFTEPDDADWKNVRFPARPNPAKPTMAKL